MQSVMNSVSRHKILAIVIALIVLVVILPAIVLTLPQLATPH